MSDIETSLESWDCIEDYSTHKNYITEVNEHNFRCELQRQDSHIWGQLYDVTAGEVVSDGEVIDTNDWDFDRLNHWVNTELEEYFESIEESEEEESEE